MEYRLKNHPIKVEASSAHEAVQAFHEIGHILGKVTELDVEPISANKTVRTYRFSKQEDGPAIICELKVLFWDKRDGIDFAVVRSPKGKLYLVDCMTGFLLAQGLDAKLPSRTQIQKLWNHRKAQLKHAKAVDSMKFWTVKLS